MAHLEVQSFDDALWVFGRIVDPQTREVSQTTFAAKIDTGSPFSAIPHDAFLEFKNRGHLLTPLKPVTVRLADETVRRMPTVLVNLELSDCHGRTWTHNARPEDGSLGTLVVPRRSILIGMDILKRTRFLLDGPNNIAMIDA